MLACKFNKFSLPGNITYLNCAYMSPLLKSVEKAGIRGIRMKKNPTVITPDDFFNTTKMVREEFGKLIGADPGRIAIIPSVSYGMAAVAANVSLKQGENVVVVGEQFPSNIYCWKRMCHEAGAALKMVAPPDTWHERGRQWNEKILEAIDAGTRVVAMGQAHWADGTKFDLPAIRKKTKAVGALLAIDGTQSVGAHPFRIDEIQPDALICAGYKWLLGPYSIGVAYYGPHFDAGRPIEENWINRLHSEDFAGLVNYEDDYHPGAARYSMGEQSNFILIPMMHKALVSLNRWGAEKIQAYCQHITREPIMALLDRGYWVEEEAFRTGHLFGLYKPGLDLDALKQELLKNRIYVSYRGNFIRVSPYVYNDEHDLHRLTKVLLRH